jgi:mono/diheme cytochrome c family protein
LNWIQALRQPNGRLFMRDSLARYGYLANPKSPQNPEGLPVGFLSGAFEGRQYLGQNCASCHVREIKIEGVRYRADGGPAIVDFERFLTDLDDAVGSLLRNRRAFKQFKRKLGVRRARSSRRLRAELRDWYRPFHLMRERALPERLWGNGRIDALSMIMNRTAGLDIGPPENGYMIPENIVPADAPVRYPFLWNADLQDLTQWPGSSLNGNYNLSLQRNTAEVLGVFGIARLREDSSLPEGVDFLFQNSVNFDGLQQLAQLVFQLEPPEFPGEVDADLAIQGAEIYESKCGGACHGINPGVWRGAWETWATPILNVGTDTREHTILTRTAKPGVLEGVELPPGNTPIGEMPLAIDISSAINKGSLLQRFPNSDFDFSSAPDAEPGSYEARVLQGIWIAAPFLHNGSVPNLEELLKPAAERVTTFEIGPNYDLESVGLSTDQPEGSYTLQTGCSPDSLDSGNSNCGHEFGTDLSDEDKKALIEYMKTL